MRLTRRAFAASTLATAALPWGSALAAGVRGSRTLPPRFSGFNTPIMWDIPFEDPKFRPTVAGLKPALMRFPGGTIANFFNWRTGRVEVQPDMMGNFAVGARNVASLHPDGATFEDFAQFARGTGCETVLVLNLETSTPEDQAAWVKQLADLGVAPSRIELGNEFYYELRAAKATGRSARIGSQTQALELSRRYIDAVRPHAPGAVFAVQSSGSRFDLDPSGGVLAEWDDLLVDAPWFDAVTWHVYPEISATMGLDVSHAFAPKRDLIPERFRSAGLIDAADAERALSGLLARVESGTRRQARFLAEKAPGKPVWVTEWGTGENVAYYRGERPVVTGLWIHVLARLLMSMMREPNIAMALNHSLYLDGLAWSCIRREESERGYKPVGAYDLFRWLDEVSNQQSMGGGPVTLIDFAMEGARAVQGAGPFRETYDDLFALGFRSASTEVTVIHNTRSTPISLNASAYLSRPLKTAEAIIADNLTESFMASTPAVKSLTRASGRVVAPPRSITRLSA